MEQNTQEQIENNTSILSENIKIVLRLLSRVIAKNSM